MSAGQQKSIESVDLGRISYEQAYARKVDALEAVLRGRESGQPIAGTVFLLEHDPPVITVSKRRGAGKHLLATGEMLDRAGVEVVETDRGGDITYHGPGQLVVYAILDLNALGLNLHAYMRLLEQVAIDTCARFGIATGRDASATGVWTNANSGDTGDGGIDGGGKICALGVRVRRWVSMHGLALNVDPDMGHFDLIVPCGLHGRRVTSMAQELGEGVPSMQEVKGVMGEVFEARIGELRGVRQ